MLYYRGKVVLSVTLTEYLLDWISLREDLRPRTVDGYKSLVKAITPYDMPLWRLRPRHVAAMLDAICDTGHSRSAEAVFVLLRSALPPAKMDGVPRPNHHPAPRRALTPSEAALYVRAALEDTQGLGPLLCLFCGLRRGEVCGLRWKDVDMSVHILHIRNTRIRLDDGRIIDGPPKSAAGIRDIPIPNTVIPLLAARRQLAGYVCPLTPSGLDQAHRRICARAGLEPLPLHGLRHTMATNALRSGASMRAIQAILGHASMATTAAIYTHPDADMLRSALDAATSLCYTTMVHH